MSNTVKLGLVQMEMRSEPSRNLDRAVEMIVEAKGMGADIVCLPELFTSTYFAQYSNPSRVEREGVPLENVPGDTAERLSASARENHVIVVGGSIYERDPAGLFNTCLTFDQDGRMLGKYRKVHIPHDENFYEQHYFTPGDLGFKVYDSEKGKFGTLICYDQWFPEAARINALMGAEIVFYPTAIGTVRGVDQAEGDWQQAWENVMRGHAIANGMVVAAVNRAGNEDQMDFWGGSFVCDAFGRTLVRASAEEQVVTATIDLDHGRNVREGWRFFQNRRPDQYGTITERSGNSKERGST
jgi:predicted amidohydrolase